MIVHMPGGHSLEEMAQQVEFIKLVSTSDGLAEALRQIADSRKEADLAISQAPALMLEITEARANLDEDIAEFRKLTALLDGRKKDAEHAEKEADKARAGLNEQAAQLEQDKAAFASYKAKAESDIEASIKIVEQNQKIAEDAKAQADRLIAEYTAKLDDLKKITG